VALSALLIPSRGDASASRQRHHVTLWTFGDDATRPGFADAVKALGADSVSASPSADVAPLAAAGLSWYEDEAAGKGTLGLRESDWSLAWDAFWDARKEAWPDEKVRRRPKCLRSEFVLKDLEDETRRNALRASGGAFAINLADEPSMTVHANPVDWCLCDRCADAFRAEMREKYDRDAPLVGPNPAMSIAPLNASWGTDYTDWSEVRPWTTAAMKARIKGVDPSKWNLAPWMETRAFQDRTFASVVAHLREVAAKAAPGVPCGLTGTQAPSAFGGFDYGLLRKSMSFVEPYDIGLALPICRDLFPRGTVIAQTVFPSGGDELLARWRLWRGVARGANATIVWSSHDALTRDSDPSPTKYGASLAADLALLSAPGGIGEKLANATPLGSGVVILYSQASVDVRWMLDSVEDGDTWPKRLGSYEATHSTAIAARDAAWRAVCDAGPRFVDVRDLPSLDLATRARSLVVLAPDILCLSAEERGAIDQLFAQPAIRGSRLHVDASFGTFDELGRATAPYRKDGIVVDPGFAAATRLGPLGKRLPVEVTVTRSLGGAAPRAELGFYEGDGSLYVVAVPAWDVATDDAGAAAGSVPAARLWFTFTQKGTAPRDVTDLRTGKRLGRADSWTGWSDAAGGLVYELR
jgi:hypothetical protein